MTDLAVTIAAVRQAAAAIDGAIAHTPVIPAPAISELVGAEVYLKLETLHRTGSFKERGALAKLLTLGPSARRAGVVARRSHSACVRPPSASGISDGYRGRSSIGSISTSSCPRWRRRRSAAFQTSSGPRSYASACLPRGSARRRGSWEPRSRRTPTWRHVTCVSSASSRRTPSSSCPRPSVALGFPRGGTTGYSGSPVRSRISAESIGSPPNTSRKPSSIAGSIERGGRSEEPAQAACLRYSAGQRRGRTPRGGMFV